jgi:hypothetical protein
VKNITDHFPPGAWLASPEGRDAIGTEGGEVSVAQVKSAGKARREHLVALISLLVPEMADEITRVNA